MRTTTTEALLENCTKDILRNLYESPDLNEDD